QCSTSPMLPCFLSSVSLKVVSLACRSYLGCLSCRRCDRINGQCTGEPDAREGGGGERRKRLRARRPIHTLVSSAFERRHSLGGRGQGRVVRGEQGGREGAQALARRGIATARPRRRHRRGGAVAAPRRWREAGELPAMLGSDRRKTGELVARLGSACSP